MKLRHLLCCDPGSGCLGRMPLPPRRDRPSNLTSRFSSSSNVAGTTRSIARTSAFISNLLADEFVATYDDGSQGDKAKELALAVQFNQQVESAVQEDFAVRIYRDTAVVWFTLRVMGVRQGQRSELVLRYTDVWVVRDGRWQCVSSQSTRVATR